MLRPELTKTLLNKMLLGRHINLVSPHGRGRRQTVADVLSLKPEGITTLYIDLKRYEGNIEIWFKTSINTLHSNKNPHWVILHNLDVTENRGLIALIKQIQAFQYVSLLMVTTEALLSEKEVEQVWLPDLKVSGV